MPRLALSVVDEQHRFGVVQRAVLDGAVEADETSAGEAIGAVGPAVHSLVMTATPIPRTLAHVVNADLDQTIIQSMPKGRKPIVTEWLTPDQRERAYQYIRHRVAEHDDQAYIIFPLVEESEHIDARAAADEFDRLRDEVFPGLSLALVHGRLSAQEKEAAMLAFHNGEARILVATTVVEVGVDVPNASIMLIDGAERFGLAQLHQLRGRIGRGSKESVCLLLTGRVSAAARDRLAAMTELVDDPRGGGQRLRNGLELAERDLALRGPGDYFGTQQSGLVDRFRFARLGDVALVNAVARVAEDVLDSDPDLTSARHKGLRALSLPYHEGAARK
jgi:ATP-dependent DNA helicase RecG